MKLTATNAVTAGNSRIWMCRNCGAVICIPTPIKPAYDCPACTRFMWHEEFAPISVFNEQLNPD